jgi:hypothetical protein
MLKNFGVKVLIKDTNQNGFIIRRLNANSYEIQIEESDEILILDPKEFIELEKEQK